MWCNQIFSLLSLMQEATEEQSAIYRIENIIIADNYEIANKIARIQYGDSAIATETTLYPVSIGFTYIDGVFYNMKNEPVCKNKTEEERIMILEEKNTELEAAVMASEQSITDLDLQDIETQQALTDMDLRLMALEG